MEELVTAARRLPSGKAAGPDGIVPEIFHNIVETAPNVILKPFNTTLKTGVFPTAWKSARLVLLYKGSEKPPSEPFKYRPISIINTTGKLLERLILARMDTYLDSIPLGRSPCQFGFRKRLSTVDALEVVTKMARWANSGLSQHRPLFAITLLDVTNAFNTLS